MSMRSESAGKTLHLFGGGNVQKEKDTSEKALLAIIMH